MILIHGRYWKGDLRLDIFVQNEPSMRLGALNVDGIKTKQTPDSIGRVRMVLARVIGSCMQRGMPAHSIFVTTFHRPDTVQARTGMQSNFKWSDHWKGEVIRVICVTNNIFFRLHDSLFSDRLGIKYARLPTEETRE